MCVVWLQLQSPSLLDWMLLTSSYLDLLQTPIKRGNKLNLLNRHKQLISYYINKNVIIDKKVIKLPDGVLHHLFQRVRPPEKVWPIILSAIQGAFVLDLAWPA